MLALLLPRFRERLTDPSLRPPDAVPVEILVLAYPISLPPPGDAPPDGAGGDDIARRRTVLTTARLPEADRTPHRREVTDPCIRT